MDEELKERWLAALESGEYEKGTQCLRWNDEYCCLGVLADICGEGWIEPDLAPAGRYSIKSGQYLFYDGPNHELQEFTPGNDPTETLMDKLANINDESDTFGPVIRYIEEFV